MCIMCDLINQGVRKYFNWLLGLFTASDEKLNAAGYAYAKSVFSELEPEDALKVLYFDLEMAWDYGHFEIGIKRAISDRLNKRFT